LIRLCRMPSLLLQPLVENAIKYAVTPKEEGADISISAKLDEDKVRITVSDTGPGQSDPIDEKTDSTGVGLANIQERLNQAYGEAHTFEIKSSSGGGFSVVITLPFETREQIEQEAAKRPATKDQTRNETIFGEHVSDRGQQQVPERAPNLAPLQHKDMTT